MATKTIAIKQYVATKRLISQQNEQVIGRHRLSTLHKANCSLVVWGIGNDCKIVSGRTH